MKRKPALSLPSASSVALHPVRAVTGERRAEDDIQNVPHRLHKGGSCREPTGVTSLQRLQEGLACLVGACGFRNLPFSSERSKMSTYSISYEPIIISYWLITTREL